MSETLVSAPLPSSFQPPQAQTSTTGRSKTFTATRPKRTRSSGLIGRIRTWNKDIVCLPYSRDSHFSIPRGAQRGHLAEKGLIGKVRFVSNWSEAQVMVCLMCFYPKCQSAVSPLY